jgi:hypothetical protein
MTAARKFACADYYEWKDGFPSRGADADLVQAELAAIRARDGGVAAEAVVEAARSPSSAMHVIFPWDDKLAAHQYRLDVARQIVRSVRLIPGDGGEPRRVYTVVAIREPGGPRKQNYQLISTIKEPEHVTQVLVSALRDLRAFVDRYRELKERLPSVYRLVGKLVEVLEKELDKEMERAKGK